jgi:hypothetical protein
MCEKHLAKAAAWQRARHKKNVESKRCIDCASPCVPDKKFCEKHLHERRERVAAKRDATRQAGICSQCTSLLAPTSKTLCERHLESSKQRTAKKRASLRHEPSIYFIRSGHRGPIKIGWVEAGVTVRLWSMQVGNPEKLLLLGFMPGTRDDELALHRRFQRLHIRGEWFRADRELLDFIASCP